VISFLLTAPLAAAPQGEIPRIEAATQGQVIDAAGTSDQAEVVRFGSSVASQLSVTAPESSLRIAGWPVAPGERADVVLTRHEVYAPDAKVWKVESGRRTEVPRSRLAFFWGTAEDDPDVRVFVSVDPDTDRLDGFALSEHATHEIHPLSSVKLGTAAAADLQYLVAPPEVFLEQAGEDPSWSCGQNGAPMDFLLGSQATGIPAEGSGLPESLTAAAITSLHTARLIIDTDTELLANKFSNNTTTAGNYVASLIAQMNVIYQRDLLIQLVQGDTFLRVGTDPWSQPSTGGASVSQLQEVTNFWSTAPNNAIPRAFVAMLSGKGGSGASGIAWVPSGLCGAGSSVSFSQVFLSGTAPSFGDVLVVAHEIGHNFGSPHSHCYSPPIDNCRSGEGAGCYSGAQSCPAPSTINGVTNVTGTLMSYCHLLGGCSSSLVFHPRSVALLQPKIQSAVGTCIFPAFTLSALNRVSGFTTGGTAVTLSGNAFTVGATVKFGGVAAVSVQVLNGNTITAVTPPHATGAVDVVVTNPGGASATKANAFFYAPPSAATDFYTLTPCRLLDTRNAAGPLGGPALGASAQRTFTVTNTCGIPANATAIAVNVTTVSPAAPGFLAIYPGNAFPLGTSSLNFTPGKNRANNAFLYLATNGTGTVGIQNNSSGALNVLVDVVGYFR
jgi:hypothetical protein